MKKNSLLAILCTIFTCMSLQNCKNNNNNNNSSIEESSSSEEVIKPSENVEDPLTKTKLVDNGNSNYVIVLPNEDSSNRFLKMAANEIISLFKEATGITLNCISDDEIEIVNKNDYYLSIGNTKIFKESKQIVDEKLGLDGLLLYTYGNCVLMNGGSYRGTLYAAYEFLERQFHFETYASDEYVIDTNVKDMFLKDFNVVEIPHFERRSVGLFCYTNDEEFRNRMRQEFYSEGWITWSHSYFKILPPDTYYSSNPEWYSKDVNQLCITNEAMIKQFTENVITMIEENPDCQYMSLGHEDNTDFCECSNCQKEVNAYKESGATIRFANKVVDAVTKHLKETDPDRKFYFSIFAYLRTLNAPLTEDKKIIDKSVIPTENLRILIAPIYACNAHNYYDECNSDINSLFSDWNILAKGRIFTWIYNKIFAEYFIPFNNFSTTVQNYNILKEIGSSFVYHQGNKETEASGMQEVKAYVQAKLMWDNTLNPEELTKDFINHYYKDAADAYYRYYNYWRLAFARWERDEKLHFYNSSSKSLNFIDTNHLTRDFVEKTNDLFLEMFASIEKYKTTNKDLYEKLNLRIQKEYLTVRYLYLKFYFDELSYSEAKEMIDEFEYYCGKHSIIVWREQGRATQVERTIASLVSQLRLKLNSK